MRIISVVGARPQFIKAAVVSKEIRQMQNEEIIIHTGQHYDENMSDVFFNELKIPLPDYNLCVGSGSHGYQTSNMLVGIEKILIDKKPNLVIVYGDTNSTLAGGLAASKLFIPIVHIEAGSRSFILKNKKRILKKDEPEELNRILVDHISEWLFCASEVCVKNLKNEGIVRNVFNVGDVMYDTLLQFSDLADNYGIDFYQKRIKYLGKTKLKDDSWYLATLHRPENVDNIKTLNEIVSALNELDKQVLFPVHPRTIESLSFLDVFNKIGNICFIQPLSYIDMLFFEKKAIKIITDSGGVQKEAYHLSIPCVTILKDGGWPETLIGNWNVLADPMKEDILHKIYDTEVERNNHKPYYGDGKAAKKITKIIVNAQ